MYPDTEWRYGAHPYNMRRSMQGCLEYLIENNRRNAIVLNAVIDEEYEKWAERNGAERCVDTMEEYAVFKSHEELLKLLKKHEYNMTYEVNAIPLVYFRKNLFSGPTELRLKKAEISYLKEYLESIFGKGNVYVPGYVMKPEDYIHMDMILAADAKRYFDTGKKTFSQKYAQQKYPSRGVNNGTLMVPFVLKHEENRAGFTYSELTSDTDPLNFGYRFIAEREAMNRKGLRNLKALNETDLNDVLQNCFGMFDSVICFPMFTAPDDTSDVTKHLRIKMREMIRAAGSKEVIVT